MNIEKEVLEKVIVEQKSLAGALKALGFSIGHSDYRMIKRLIAEYDIDISHFTGKSTNCGNNHKGGIKKIGVDILCLRTDGKRVAGKILKRCLFELGVPNECYVCKNAGHWLEKRLVIEIDHIDGNRCNNEKSNLRLLCPNCHSQTHTFRNKSRNPIKKEKYKKNFKYKLDGFDVKRRIFVKWPENDELEKMIWSKSLRGIAKDLNVCVTSIIKRCKKVGIQRPRQKI